MKAQSTLRGLLLVVILAATLVASGCAGKKTAGEETPTAPGMDENANTMGDSDSGKAMGLQTIHFGYDSFALEEGEKANLKSNAEILKSKTSLKIQIEGHCDQRGGIQYNIALGEKRANAVKKFLEGMGISGERVTTISYGKERPLDTGSTEAAYSKNRRANFAITSK